MKILKRFVLYGIPKSFLFKIILALLIILFGKNVFALEVDVTNSITSPNSSSTGKYQGTEIYNTGGDFTYNVNTRYNGRLSRIRFNLPLPDSLGQCFTTNVDYKVTLNMATSDWRNKFGSVTASAYNVNYAHYPTVFVSQKKIYFTFKIPSSTTTCIDYVFVDLKSTDVSSTAFTGETNWNLQSIKLSDPTISTGSGSSGSSPTPTPKPDYSDIINNQNENTNNIINNQNDNTNNIIENNNQNTETITNSIQQGAETITNVLGNKCLNLFDKKKYGFDYRNKIYFDLSNLEVGKTYTISTNNLVHVYKFSTTNNTDAGDGVGPQIWSTPGFYSWTFVYDGNPRLFMNTNEYGTNFNETLSSLANYNFMLVEGSTSKAYCEFGSFSSKLDDTNSAINQVNESINNSNVDSGTGSDFFNDFQTQDNGGISAIITKPLMIINNLLSNNNQCFNLPLPEFMGVTTAYLPSGCILWNNAPQIVITLWNIFVCGFGAYYILKDLFKIIENLKNPDNDRVEVIDL